MIKYKVKDPEHEYYKRCDIDCDDPTSYLIHQIRNPSKHSELPYNTNFCDHANSRTVACPLCGIEFGCEEGRATHIEQVCNLPANSSHFFLTLPPLVPQNSTGCHMPWML